MQRDGRPLRVTLLTARFSDTQIFRAEALHLLARHLGHETKVVTTQPGDVVESIADTAFGAHLRQVRVPELVDLVDQETDVLCTVKPLPATLGLGQRVARLTGTPLLADIDDPDIEVRTLWSGATRAQTVRRLTRDWRQLPLQAHLALRARQAVTTVSNPVLQARWGGEIVPHARVDRGPGAPHRTEAPRVAFVGTPKRHKGIPLLRRAIAELAPEGWSLVVTDRPPPDARAWETWLGPIDRTTDSAGITAAADVVAVPSEGFGYGTAQLPLKLVDAMLMGRAVVVSSAGPLPWAVGGTGRVFTAGSLPSLVQALRPLSDPDVRAEHGRCARAMALKRYTVDSAAPAFQRALDQATAAHGRSRSLAPRGLRRPPPG